MSENPSVRPFQSLPCPHTPAQSYIRFLQLRPEQTLSVTLASPSWFGTLVHWTGTTSRPCLGHRQQCGLCACGQSPRWTAYAVVYLSGGRIPRIASWTERAHRACTPLEREQGHLAGARLDLVRAGPKSNSPLCLKWTGERFEGPMEPILDVATYLCRLWNMGCNERIG